jgi:hypothetical protein
MLVGLFVLSIILIVVIRLTNRKSRLSGRSTKRLPYLLSTAALRFVEPIAVTLLFYLVLSVYVNAHITDEATIKSLRELERVLDQIHSVVSAFKLEGMTALLVLIGVFVVGMIFIPTMYTRKLFKGISWYRNRITWLYMLITLLCSFTFFGPQLSEHTRVVRLRIRTIQTEYDKLCMQIQQAITEDVAKQLYEKSFAAMPAGYKDSLGLPAKLHDNTTALRDYYAEVKVACGVRVFMAETVLRQYVPSTGGIVNLNVEPGQNETTARVISKDVFETTSLRDIKRAQSVVHEYRTNVRQRVIRLLTLPGGKDVVLQVPSVITNKLSMILTEIPVIQEYPILKPVIETMVSALDDVTRARIEKGIDTLTKAGAENPHMIAKRIASTSGEIANARTITVTHKTVAEISQETQRLQKAISAITEAHKAIIRASVPAPPKVQLHSNLSVTVEWNSVPRAGSYRVYRGGAVVTTTSSQSYQDWPGRFPASYRVIALIDGQASAASPTTTVNLRSSRGGSSCQICGQSAVGYCHNRNIYVCSSCSHYRSKEGINWRCP